MAQKPFGSGYFGEWLTDEFGLPAYRYTCNQVHDPAAVSPVNPAWRGPTDHSHQVGNDRLVGVASNFGYIQVRQDEGGPKFLNDYDPAHGHYAGGFGYLTDSKRKLSTFYNGEGADLERIFGIGYLRKVIEDASCRVDHVIFAPYGDDPLLISQVTLSNLGKDAVDLGWVEYWGCRMVQFSHRSQVLAVVSRGKKQVPELRRAFSDQFSQHFVRVGAGDGLINSKQFRGYPLRDQISWGVAQFFLSTVARKSTGGALKPPVKEAWLEDCHPPATFLVSLDAPADGMWTDEAGFFGKGGPADPDGLAPGWHPSQAMEGGQGLFLERRLSLAPGESRTLYFAYGYLPGGFELDRLLAKYKQNLSGLWGASSLGWLADRIGLEIPGEPWVERELAWHHYYLRSSATYDSFYREHILSQGHVYQYILGFQGAARDPLQHALPFTFSDPELVKQVLRYTLKEVLPDGEIPYGVTGNGMRMAVPFRPSDQELWLLWLASEYVLATRDRAFLDEILPTFPLYGSKAGKESVRNLLWRCLQHFAKVTGTGRHGIMRLSNGDWNDGSVIGYVPNDQHEDVRLNGESTLNAAFATYTLDIYADLLFSEDEAEKAAEVRQLVERQRQAVRSQWTGRWFRRGWLSERLGWIGDTEMWLEPQPWAIIGGSATPEQQEELVQALNELVRDPSPLGALLTSSTLPPSTLPPGTLTNGGIWPSINGTLVWALAQLDGKLAWEEWQKNSLAYHAEAYPRVWYGIWSGPDCYNSVLSKYPGQTFFDEKALAGEGESTSLLEAGVNWTDFPVLNLHPHAWPVYDVVKLLGVKFTAQGVEFSPNLPQDTYRFGSPLLGLEKSPTGYTGWYAPSDGGQWRITLLDASLASALNLSVRVNDQDAQVQYVAGGIAFSGESTPGSPLRWEVRRRG
jgi:hypothetical protein